MQDYLVKAYLTIEERHKLEVLKSALGVKSNSGVIRKLIALIYSLQFEDLTNQQ
tara:strand:+ start:24453 stop:24614 length:162 start_codon:yes stop_codon:yes gene_type:complete